MAGGDGAGAGAGGGGGGCGTGAGAGAGAGANLGAGGLAGVRVAMGAAREVEQLAPYAEEEAWYSDHGHEPRKAVY